MIVRVKRAQRGDAEAFIALIEENKMGMQRVSYGFFRNEEDVADVIQDTILDALEHLKELKNARYFKTWLIRILINNCNRIYNKNKRNVTLEHIPEVESCKVETSNREFYELISSLPEDARLIFQLYYGEGFTSKEIAKMLVMKENTVKSKLHRGKEQLREEMWEESGMHLCSHERGGAV